jgi:hypothetical protein
MKNSSNAVGIRTRNPPSCSAVPQLNINMGNFRLLKAASWLRCLDSGLLPRSSEILTGSIQVNFVGGKGTFLQVLLQVYVARSSLSVPSH